jgi:hypothetical protein
VINIGDFVTYDGRVHRFVGVTPIGVQPFAVQLQHPTTGEVFCVGAEQDPASAGVIAGVLWRVERADRRRTAKRGTLK